MKISLLERIIAESSEAKNSFISFCWHGGEPLLAGYDFFCKVIEFQKKYFGGIFRDARCENIIQTNGLLLNDKYYKLFYENSFHIGLSLDGPDIESNIYRFPEHSAEKLFYKTISKIKELVSYGFDVSVINVIHDHNHNKCHSLYYFYKDLGVKTISFNPRFLKERPEENLNPNLYLDFIKNMISIQKEDQITSKNALSLGIANQLQSKKSSSLCFLADRCHEFININSFGEIFATCADWLDTKIGDVNFERQDLKRIVETEMNHPRQEVKNRLLSDSCFEDGSCKGCPKYSYGKKDVYINKLLTI